MSEETETLTLKWTTVLGFLVLLFLGISGILYAMFIAHETKTEAALSLKADKLEVEKITKEIKEELIRNRVATDALRDAIVNQLTDIRRMLPRHQSLVIHPPGSKLETASTAQAEPVVGNKTTGWSMRP